MPQIVHKVLGEAGVEHRLSLTSSYPKREYCVQYRESDLDFVSRLLEEEEGIFYFCGAARRGPPRRLRWWPRSSSP